MLFGRYGSFAGGIDLPDEKYSTIDRAIEPYKPTRPVRVPLAPCGGRSADPIVQPGEKVSIGQKIAVSTDAGAVDVFSPVSGKVVSMTTAEVGAVDSFVPTPAMEISPDDGPTEPVQADQDGFDWRVAGAVELRRRIKAGGLTTCRRPVVPLARWITRARSKRCRTLIANAMEAQPFVTAAHRLLIDRADEVTGGLAILGRAIGANELIISVDRRRTGDYERIVELAGAYGIARVALPHKYPTGADPMLVKVLTRKERPPGGSVMDVGSAVVDPATCAAVYRWVAKAIPPTGRVVTVAGPRSGRSGNFFVPFGVNCLELVAQDAQPVIQNGPMIGLRCGAEAVVGCATDAVLALEASVPAPPSPCIRCSWCTDHCPARLNVAALNDAFELSDLRRARKLVAAACVECGVCSYVCPARLPLSERVKQLKRALMSIKEAMPLLEDI